MMSNYFQANIDRSKGIEFINSDYFFGSECMNIVVVKASSKVDFYVVSFSFIWVTWQISDVNRVHIELETRW